MADGIVSFIFFSKSALWITVGTQNFGGLNCSFLSILHCTFFGKRAENTGEQFCQLKEKMGFILKKRKGPALTTTNNL